MASPPADMATPAARRVRSILQLGAHEHYQTLGVRRSATQADIQQAYIRLARHLHPGKNLAAGAEEAFKRVAQAKAVLSDAVQRATHDAGMDGVSSKEKRKPYERRADRKRKARGSGDVSDHAGDSRDDAPEFSAASDSDESVEYPWAVPSATWGSWQARDLPAASGSAQHGKKSHRAKRRAVSRAAAAATSSAAAKERTHAEAATSRIATKGTQGGGKGRGHLGKRPWRRAARVAAKLEAKRTKKRAKERQHLQW